MDDPVYFKNLFEQISNLANPQMINKRVVFITKDIQSGNNIKNNLLDAKINIYIAIFYIYIAIRARCFLNIN